MKIQTCFLTLLCAVAFAPAALAQLNIPGNDGSDGTFFPLETNVVVDLSQAVPGTWDQPSPQPGKGVFDANKWVIVFKYRNIVIPQGFRVTFKNHPSRAPVIWLSTNNVNIDGIVDLSGSPSALSGLTEPGPGGFRGGAGDELGLNFGAGLGPGGAYNADGAFSYGNARLVPLIGGYGGSGYFDSGAGGSGAMLLAARRTVTINGAIRANSVPGVAGRVFGSGGGGIRVVANQIAGSGEVLASRIRIETPSISQSLNINRPTIAVQPSNPVEVVQSDSSPSVRVVSLGNEAAPLDPRAELGNSGTDIVVTNAAPVPVLVETRNMPPNSTVVVTLKPKHPAAANVGSAVINLNARYLSGDTTLAFWGVTNSMPLGHFIVQVRAVTP